MLEIRPNCENCNKNLPFDAEDAVICTFECTYCSACASGILKNVCPNCGGNFSKRPIRPKQLLEKYPASNKRIFKPVNIVAHHIKIAESQ